MLNNNDGDWRDWEADTQAACIAVDCTCVYARVFKLEGRGEMKDLLNKIEAALRLEPKTGVESRLSEKLGVFGVFACVCVCLIRGSSVFVIMH